MGWSKSTTTQGLPAWVASQLRARNLCECCSQRNADTIWAGTGQNVCWQCCEAKRSDGPVTVTAGQRASYGNQMFRRSNEMSAMTVALPALEVHCAGCEFTSPELSLVTCPVCGAVLGERAASV